MFADPPVTPAPGAEPADSSAPTRDRILDAAERLFAEGGFRATSVRRITRESECNVAAVNYHFGGKARLYREVFRRRLSALREQRVAAVGRAMSRAGERADLELLLRAFTSAFVEPLLEESTGRMWVRLMAWELIDRQLPREVFEAEMMIPVQTALVAALGRLCPGLDAESARRSVQSLVAQLVHIVHLHRLLEAEEGAAAADERFPLGDLVDHTVQFSAAGIRALAEGRS